MAKLTNFLYQFFFFFAGRMHFAVNEMARLSWRGMAQTQGDWSPRVDPPCKTCFLEWVNMMMMNFGIRQF
jgi:hypothetical protein